MGGDTSQGGEPQKPTCPAPAIGDGGGAFPGVRGGDRPSAVPHRHPQGHRARIGGDGATILSRDLHTLPPPPASRAFSSRSEPVGSPVPEIAFSRSASLMTRESQRVVDHI